MPLLVFHEADGKPLGEFKRSFKTACRRAGIKPGFTFHDLRHSFANAAASRGVSLQVLQKLLGHKSYEMVLRYAHLQPDMLVGEVEQVAD